MSFYLNTEEPGVPPSTSREHHEQAMRLLGAIDNDRGPEWALVLATAAQAHVISSFARYLQEEDEEARQLVSQARQHLTNVGDNALKQSGTSDVVRPAAWRPQPGETQK